MAKGSVRKKGKKWYYRFYVEDASGKMVQKEYAGTESKSETEKLLRKALEDYENKKFVAKAMGFESNDEYNEIMFLREITPTINALNEMADVVRLYSKKPKAAEQRLANLLSEVMYDDSESV